MTTTYDTDADVLYVTFEKVAGPCTYVDTDNLAVLRIEEASGRIVGCTILYFMERIRRDGNVRIPQIGAVPFNESTLELLHA